MFVWKYSRCDAGLGITYVAIYIEIVYKYSHFNFTKTAVNIN